MKSLVCINICIKQFNQQLFPWFFNPTAEYAAVGLLDINEASPNCGSCILFLELFIPFLDFPWWVSDLQGLQIKLCISFLVIFCLIVCCTHLLCSHFWHLEHLKEFAHTPTAHI